jgi:hypothetical protein
MQVRPIPDAARAGLCCKSQALLRGSKNLRQFRAIYLLLRDFALHLQRDFLRRRNGFVDSVQGRVWQGVI